MDELTKIVADINGVLWGVYCLIPLLVGAGIYFTLRLRLVQIRRFGLACKIMFKDFSLTAKADNTGMSPFQSLATAVAAQVGTGNLAGAATAIAMGGPGAIFWMWLAAFFGMATIFAEAVLGQIYKTTDDKGVVVGGPAYYISKGLGSKGLAAFFAIAIIVALGLIGNMVQVNSAADAFYSAFNVPKLGIGLFIAAFVGFVFLGGMARLASTTEKIVPFMALVYLVGGLYIVITHIDMLIPAFEMIFVGAFNPSAATGGLIGVGIKEAMRYGIARGLFSNEAGMGSTPHAHAIAKVKHPAQQGFVAILGVAIDTFIVLNMTALVILMTGALGTDPANIPTGITLTQKAFSIGLGDGIGHIFIAVCLLFFVLSTVIGWLFFAEQNVKYLFGTKGIPSFRIIALIFILLGSLLKVDLVWELTDMFNGIMVLPNLLALFALAKIVSKALEEYEKDHIQKL